MTFASVTSTATDAMTVLGRSNGNWWVMRTNATEVVNEQWGSWDPFQDWDDILIVDLDRDGLADIAGRSGNDWWAARSNSKGFDSSLWGQWPNCPRLGLRLRRRLRLNQNLSSYRDRLVQGSIRPVDLFCRRRVVRFRFAVVFGHFTQRLIRRAIFI